MFAGLISFLVLVSATAVEMGRWAIARNELQAAMDAAVLAGAAKLQQNQADKNAAVETAKKAFKANRSRQRFGTDIVDNISFSVDGTSLYAIGSADLSTVLAKVVGMNTLPLAAACIRATRDPVRDDVLAMLKADLKRYAKEA